MPRKSERSLRSAINELLDAGAGSGVAYGRPPPGFDTDDDARPVAVLTRHQATLLDRLLDGSGSGAVLDALAAEEGIRLVVCDCEPEARGLCDEHAALAAEVSDAPAPSTEPIRPDGPGTDLSDAELDALDRVTGGPDPGGDTR